MRPTIPASSPRDGPEVRAMDDGIIQASYVWTTEEFLAASEVSIRRRRSSIILWGLRFLALVLAIIGTIGLVFGEESRWAGLLFLAPALSLAWSTSLTFHK